MLDDCESAEQIIDALSFPESRPSAETVKLSLDLLCALFARWKDSVEIREALDIEKNFDRSLAALNYFLLGLENEPLLDALTIVIRKFVISNHLHIAGQKLASSGTFTYRFLSEDGVLKDSRLTKYDYTTPRLFNLLWFAEDLGLIVDEKLTNKAREILDVA